MPSGGKVFASKVADFHARPGQAVTSNGFPTSQSIRPSWRGYRSLDDAVAVRRERR
jgi:hypothetical protein